MRYFIICVSLFVLSCQSTKKKSNPSAGPSLADLQVECEKQAGKEWKNNQCLDKPTPSPVEKKKTPEELCKENADKQWVNNSCIDKPALETSSCKDLSTVKGSLSCLLRTVTDFETYLNSHASKQSWKDALASIKTNVLEIQSSGVSESSSFFQKRKPCNVDLGSITNSLNIFKIRTFRSSEKAVVNRYIDNIRTAKNAVSAAIKCWSIK